MKWNRFTIKTKTEAEDMIICTLAEIGVEGAEIQDHQPLTEEDKAQMFVDIMPEGPADSGRSQSSSGHDTAHRLRPCRRCSGISPRCRLPWSPPLRKRGFPFWW